MMEPVQQPDVRQSRRSVWFKRESIVIMTARRLMIDRLEEAGRPPEIDQIPFEQIFWLQSSVILLFSWLQVNWVAHGSEDQETIYFSSICEKLFLDLVSIASTLDGVKRTFLAQISPECTNSFSLLTPQI